MEKEKRKLKSIRILPTIWDVAESLASIEHRSVGNLIETLIIIKKKEEQNHGNQIRK